jgi:hypothetical protein
MKTRRYLALIAFLALSLPCMANIEAVDLDRLPDSAGFRQSLGAVLANRAYVDHYSGDWKYPVAKDDLLASIGSFEEEVAALAAKDAANVDLSLLDLVLLGYLYNLDKPGIAALIEARAAALIAARPDDYRVLWLLGEFHASAARPVEAVSDFDRASALEGSAGPFPPAYHEARAMAFLFAGMYRNAMCAFETAATLRGVTPETYSPYAGMKKALVRPDLAATYKDSAVWEAGASAGGYRITNRAMGVSIPVAPEWKLRLTGYSPRRSIALITPQTLRDGSGRDIGISLLFWLSTAEEGYDAFVASSLASFKVVSREKRLVNGIEFEVCTWEDPSKYQAIGGAIGYFAFARLPPPAHPGTRIEYPHAAPASAGGGSPSYYALTQVLDRFDREVYVGIMMDSCHAIFDQASKLYWDLVGSTIFE